MVIERLRPSNLGITSNQEGEQLSWIMEQKFRIILLNSKRYGFNITKKKVVKRNVRSSTYILKIIIIAEKKIGEEITYSRRYGKDLRNLASKFSYSLDKPKN